MVGEAEGQSREEGGAEPARRRPRGRYGRRRKVCMFCVEHVTVIDYKDVSRLRRFLSDRGRIEPRRKLGTCARHQRALSQALKRARHLALLPYTAEHIRAAGSFSSRQ
jgi:small subunit ribosomal protein S18